ncbi:UNVERIFIED_CONTAM: hypothetical protein H355_015111 [Colinus virginianus]|nr:hypothetical protein H355_015111 [Colinus virginianus]
MESKSLHILSMVVYSIACVLGVTGNGLVIWIAGFKMKKTVNSVWFLNLAIADFIFTFFLPLSIAYTALDFHWPFGKLLCKLNSTIAFLNMFASVFLLMVISVDRCVAVAFPVWSHNRRSPELAARVALGTWSVAVLLSSPYLVFRDTAVSSRNITSCYNNFALSDDYTAEETRRLWRMRHKAMIITRFLCGFLIPFTVILICYSIVAVKLKRRQLASSAKPYRIIIAVTVSFFLCYFPYHVFSLLEISQNPSSHEMKMALYIGIPLVSSLAFFNSCINPILYVFVGPDFKEKFRQSILSTFEGAFSEESVLGSLSSRRKSRRLGVEMGKVQVYQEPNRVLPVLFLTETRVQIQESVRGKDVFIIQTVSKDVNTTIMELLIMVYACKTSCAKSIIGVIPYFPYSKQCKMRKRGSIVSKLLASMMCKAGLTHLITMDLHQKEIQGFFNIPVDNLRASPFLLQYIQEEIPDYRNAVIVAKSPASAKRAQSFAERLRLGIAVIHGEAQDAESDMVDGRHSPPTAKNVAAIHPSLEIPMLIPKEKPPITVVGDVGGRIAIIVDDIIDDVDSFLAAAETLKERGAYKIFVMATHGLLSSDAPRLIEESAIDEVVVTNTIPHEIQKLQCPKIKTVDISMILSEAIRRIHNGESMSYLFRNIGLDD